MNSIEVTSLRLVDPKESGLRGIYHPTPQEAAKVAEAVGTPLEKLFPEMVGTSQGELGEK